MHSTVTLKTHPWECVSATALLNLHALPTNPLTPLCTPKLTRPAKEAAALHYTPTEAARDTPPGTLPSRPGPAFTSDLAST